MYVLSSMFIGIDFGTLWKISSSELDRSLMNAPRVFALKPLTLLKYVFAIRSANGSRYSLSTDPREFDLAPGGLRGACARLRY